MSGGTEPLEESLNELCYEAVQHADDIIYITDTDGRIEYVNPAFEDITGYEEDEVLGKTPNILNSGEYDDSFYDEMWETINAGDQWQTEIIDETKSGERIVLDQTISPITNADDEVERFVAVAHDVTDRKEREEEIQTHLEQAQEIGNVGSWHIDLDENSLHWSDECYRIFGMEPGQPITYDRFLESVHPDDRTKVTEAWTAALDGEPYEIEHRIVVDDEIKWVRETAEVAFDEDNEPIEGIGVVRDITEQREREHKLIERKQRYESLLESAPDPVFVADSDTGELIEANEAAESLREQDRDEILGLHQSKLHPPDEREQVQELFSRVVEEGGVWRKYLDGSQIHAISSTGEKVPVSITVNTFRLPERRVSYGVFRDITDQIEREREISVQKRRYESLFNSISGAIVVTDLDGCIRTCNPGFVDLFGYDIEDVEGDHIGTVMAADAPVESLFETNADAQKSRVLNYRKKSGQVFPGESRTSPLRTHDGDIRGHVVHIIDVSDAQKNREQLQVLGRVLRHNIKNSMNVIMSQAELVQDQHSDGDMPAVEKILETSRKFVEMAENQQRITELLTGNTETVTVDLVPILDETVSDLQRQYPAATLQTDLLAECQVCTTREIGDAIQELVQNAIVHSDQAQPSVEIGLRRTERITELTIRDDGPGIPDEEWSALTPDGEIEPLSHGTGLGLWFVDQVVSQSNGTMTFDTNDSGGTRITVCLPSS